MERGDRSAGKRMRRVEEGWFCFDEYGGAAKDMQLQPDKNDVVNPSN